MDLSIVISAHNEEEKIAACLDSLKTLNAEVIVIDHESDDRTGEIARRYTPRVYRESNDPKAIDLQKNKGFAKATKEWILSLDADERLTPELIEEIKSKLPGQRSANEVAGFLIPRKNIIFGKWIEHTGWYPDYQLRLFRRGKGAYHKQHVHEMIEVTGKTGQLSSPLLHLNYDSISQFLHKHLVLYAPNEAEYLWDIGYTFAWQDAIRMPTREFLSRYFARQGYLDGLHGLMLSLFMACYHFVIFAFLWEKQKFPKEEEKVTLNAVSGEFKQAGKDLNHWVKTTKTESEKNPFLRKIKRTLS